MNNITLSTNIDCGFTPVSNIFINTFMPDANGEYVKIYLYLLKCLNEREVNVTISDIADSLEKTDADIKRAIKYWEKKGILKAGRDENKDITSIMVVNLNAGYSGEDPGDIPAVSEKSAVEKKAPEKKLVISPVDRSKADSDELRSFKFRVEKYFGRPLTMTDVDILLNLCYAYEFTSIDCVEEVVLYSVSRGKKSMRYIEKVAVTALEHGARSLSEVKNYLASSKFTVISVMQAFGLQQRLPGNDEMDYILKWSDTLGFDNDLIVEACDRAMNKTHGPSFKYADSILTSWHKEGVRSMEDVEKLDNIYKAQAANTYAKKNPNGKNPGKPLSKFNDIMRSNIDMAALEQKLLSGDTGE